MLDVTGAAVTKVFLECRLYVLDVEGQPGLWNSPHSDASAGGGANESVVLGRLTHKDKFIRPLLPMRPRFLQELVRLSLRRSLRITRRERSSEDEHACRVLQHVDVVCLT